MSRKIVLLISIMLLLGLSGNASAVLKGWWRLNEGSGSTATDSSGNGYNGTITGAAWVNDGTRGYVLDFEGADYVAIPTAAVSLTTTVTIALWQYGDAALQPQANCIFEGTRGGNRTLNGQIPWTGGGLLWDAGYAGTTYDRISKAATDASQYEGQWNHWAFTKSTSSGQMRMYLNGTVWTSGTGKTRTMSGVNAFKIGSDASGSQNYDGMISDFRVYNTVLTETEIRVLAGWTRTISGTVGSLDGVTMGGLPGSPVTSGGGAYTATVDNGWTGTATPSKAGYTFNPTNKTYSNVTANQSAQNYTPTLLTYTISGTVGTVSGVTMSGLPVETFTSGGGAYSATVDYGWTGTVTPQKDGYTFSPTNKTYSNVTANQSTQIYTPTLVTYTISGHVGSLDGVTMSGLPGNPSTSGGGAYSVTVTTTWSGTVTPAKTGYTFSPTSRMYSNVGSNLTEDYTPIINTYTISGNVGTVGDVTMSGLPDDPVTSSGGAYSAIVTYGWSGTVTPTRTNYTFSPTNKTYSNITSDLVDQDYTSSTTIPDESLVGWWPFNGDSEDYSGYGHDGTVTGASYVSSSIGTVLDFEGADYVSIPSSTFTTINDQITIALWQYGDAAMQPQQNYIFEGTNSGSNRLLGSHLPWSDGVVYWDAGYAGTTWDRINKNATANQYEGQWNHWVFTKSLVTDQMKIYLNGALWHSGTAKSKSMSGITTFKIGSNANGTSNYDGMIAEFRIYNRTMSATEITDLYNASYEATVPSPADETTGVATSADLSWTAGYLAGEHDVYFGTNVAAVTNREQSAFKGSQSGTTYDPGTLANGMTYYWAVDEVNDYYENSPWLGDVYSFTTVGAGITCPICGGQGECNLDITNFNSRLGRISGVQKVNIIRVTMSGKTTASLSTLKSNVYTMDDFYRRASYGRLGMSIQRSVSYNVPVAGLTTTRNRVIAYANTLPSAFLTYVQWPTGLASYSNSGSGRIYCNDSLDRTVQHETGHIIGLGHSNKNINGVFVEYGDPSSIMGSMPSQNYAVNQQHWLGWPKGFEMVNITDCLNKVSYIDVPLRPVNSGGGGLTSDIPNAYCYEIPDTSQRLWIAIPKGISNNVNAIEGGEIFIYRADKEQGCTGMCMGSALIGRIGSPKTAEPREIEGLIIDPISWVSTTGQFEGHNVDNFSQITLRFSLADQPPVDDPNDYNEPGEDCIANWNFGEVASTVLRDTANNGLTGPATWIANRAGITTSGDETLNFAPTTNTTDGSVTYFDLVGAASAITSGKVWAVVEVNDFNFAGGTVGERLRFGFTNAMANDNITAEFILMRVASNSIHLMGYAGGTLPSTGVQVHNSNIFAGQLEICTEYDFDADTYQIFYRLGGTGSWTSIGAASAVYSGRVGNALRLCAGDSSSSGTGSWADAGEYFHIDRIYMTTIDPKIEPANASPAVWITYPDDDDTFTPGSNITLQAIADDTDGNVADLEFYRGGTTLIGQGQSPAVQNNIVNSAGQATIHGATAVYSGGCINSWTNVNDWVSWTATVVRSGTFEVWVNYSCKNNTPGSTYRVEAGDQHVHGTVASTGSDWLTFDSVYLGTVDIAETGQIAVNVIPETRASGGAIMNMKDVTLIPFKLDDCYQYTWSNVQAGTYTLTSKATDDDDAETVSEPIVITVQQ